MTPEQINLVQNSFRKVEPIADKAAELFYGRLFEIAPDVKPLFSVNMEEQGKKLMTMIGIAVKGLSDLEKIVPAVKQLGERHISYGVKDAWATTYGVLSQTMIDAMNA